MSGWEREAEFRSLLQKVSAKATKDALDTVADIAVRDDKVVCYPVLPCRCQAAALLLLLLLFLARFPPACQHAIPSPSPCQQPPWRQAYKAVCALLVHEMKALKPSYRLRLFYALSAILRQSKSRRGERDKYGAPRLGRACWCLSMLHS